MTNCDGTSSFERDASRSEAATEFEIVTYCSSGFRGALALTLPSWIKNSGASRIVVYSDRELPVPEASHREAATGVTHVPLFDEVVEDGPTSWIRKIIVLQAATSNISRDIPRAPSCFCWVDADVYCAEPFGEVFGRMGRCDIGATRMFNHTHRGAGRLNAGVLFFRDTKGTSLFLLEWLLLARALMPRGGWFEQCAASDLLHLAFHGLKPYDVAPLSENLYNLEDDSQGQWLERIKFYKPKLIHFKNGWWKRRELVARVLNIVETGVG